jgi:hypothetical protein
MDRFIAILLVTMTLIPPDRWATKKLAILDLKWNNRALNSTITGVARGLSSDNIGALDFPAATLSAQEDCGKYRFALRLVV